MYCTLWPPYYPVELKYPRILIHKESLSRKSTSNTFGTFYLDFDSRANQDRNVLELSISTFSWPNNSLYLFWNGNSDHGIFSVDLQTQSSPSFQKKN